MVIELRYEIIIEEQKRLLPCWGKPRRLFNFSFFLIFLIYKILFGLYTKPHGTGLCHKFQYILISCELQHTYYTYPQNNQITPTGARNLSIQVQTTYQIHQDASKFSQLESSPKFAVQSLEARDSRDFGSKKRREDFIEILE